MLMAVIPVCAQVQVKVQSPSEVVEGDRFRIAYVVNTNDLSDFSVGEFQGATVLFGPMQSTSSSFSIVNGKTTSSSSVTFTYTLQADKAGTYKTPVATVVSDGKTYHSPSRALIILKGSGGHSRGGASQGEEQEEPQPDRMRTQQSGERISGSDLFIAVTASRKRVFEQEAVLLTYKLYTLVSISEMTGKMPQLDNLYVQELNRKQQPQLKMEHYNGKNYGSAVWSQYVVFPQKTGKITIPAIKFDAVVLQRNRSVDPWDAFFGGGSTVTEVKKVIMAPEVTLQVDELPSPKPANFSGAVGRFQMSTSLTPESLKANDALTLRATVTGTGNLKLMKAPEVKWPADFESYSPKTEDKTKIGASGLSGSMIYDFIAVPRHAGKYDIPSVEFCYFDTESRQYKTLRDEPHSVAVAKGSGGGTSSGSISKEDIELLGNDIRFIKSGSAHYQSDDASLFGSLLYWAYYIVPLLVFLFLVVAFRRYAVANADVVGRKGRKANKAATKRLKQARRLMQKHEANAFYEETMKALWGYVGDKLNIPVSELSKENVRERLAEKQVETDIIEEFISTLNECEFARFAPGDPADTMDKLYASAEDVINKMESDLKKK
ncbi:MAG: BatD family protein [Bacteroidaceae bacterium]|nr:BatD family protein [Bacteroidaceae bacterium]